MAVDKPNPKLIYSLVSEAFKPQVVRVALLLDVFTPLAKGPAEASALAAACQCDPTGMQYLLDYLVSIRVLKASQGSYELTPSAEQFLVRDSQSFAGDMLLEYTDPETWDSLLNTLRSGEFGMIESEKSFVGDAWLESYLEENVNSSLALWKSAGVNPKNQANFRVLDLGCGCGVKSFVLAKEYKNVWITCLDNPQVIEVARELAEKMNLRARTSFLTDVLPAPDLGRDRYEACLMGQVTHYLTQGQNQALFKRVYKAMAKEATLVIESPMRTAGSGVNTNLVNLLVWASNGGGTHSYGDYTRWLKQAGFKQVNKINDQTLVAKK